MDDNMKGLILAVGDFPEGNATAMRLKLMAKAFYAGGFPVTVALLHATLKYQVPENRAVAGVVDEINYVYLGGHIIRPVGLPGAIRDTIRGIGGALRLLLRAERVNFLVLYTPSFAKHGLPVLAALFRGIPIFVEVCEIRSRVIGGGKRHPLGKMVNSLEWIMEWLTPRIARGIIPISQRIADFYRRKGVSEERIFLLPILVEADQYVSASTDEVPALTGKSYFLNSGSFAEKDGVDYLTKAFSQVARLQHNLFLVFTGAVREHDKKKVLNDLAEYGVADRVLFVGMLSRAQLIWAYQHALGLLCCRTNSEYANYGFPTKLGEYLASGSPVIATRVGDIEDYLRDGETVYLAEAEKADSIASCMQRIVGHAEEARRIGQNGQRVALTNFHYSQYRESLVSFVRKRLADSKPY